MRLIDADKLVEEYLKLTEMADKRNLDDYVSGMITVGMLIHKQPTAYDADKVLDALERYMYDIECDEGVYVDIIDYDNAIDIVKRGGADDQE